MSGTEWQVLDDAASVLVSEYSIGAGNRTTTLVCGFGDSSLLVVSPGPDPAPDALAALEARGRVAALLAPNGFHRAGLAAWSRAFPDAIVHAGEGAAARVGRVVGRVEPIGTLQAGLGAAARLMELPCVRSGEVWLSCPAGLYTGDTFANLRPDDAFSRALLAVLGLGGGLRRNPWQRRLMATDRGGLDRWITETVRREAPTTLIPGHGDIERGADLAARLLAMLPARAGPADAGGPDQ